MRGIEQSFVGTRRFDLRGRLGDGGGGVVYRAFDRQREQEVALKLMHRRDDDDPFHASFSALAELAHPNLVRLYELVDEGDRQMLCMELIEGVDLLRYVSAPERVEVSVSTRGFDELRLRAVFAQLAQALSALHAVRKVHRDVKPANVRVTAQGRVVLLDLDLALDLDAERSERARGHTQRPVGTATYMAPEQAVAQRLGPASDWYSLGVVLYEALTGVRPYAGSDLAVLLEKQQARPRPPTELVADLPSDLAELCVELLTPEPSERPTGPEILRRLSVHEHGLTARWTAASLLSARPPFLGRQAELAQLVDAFARSRRTPIVARVVGEAGMGKSALCLAALARFAESEPRSLALSGVCSRYPDKPHAPLHEPIAKLAEALRERGNATLSASALRLLERAFPGVLIGLEAKTHGRTALAPEPLEQRWRTVAALSAILAELSRARPVVIWLDDYQWADVDTQRFVSALLETGDAPRVLLILSEEPAPGALSAPSPRAHETIQLGELSCAEGRALIDELSARAQAARPDVERLWSEDRASHSPLALLERTRQALLYPEVDVTELRELYAYRVAQLREPARRVLELVCAAFDAAPYAIFERAAELSPADFTKHVSTLRVAGLVRSVSLHGEDALAPGHPRVAELVDLELTGPRRVLIHQRLSAALIARDGMRAAGRLLRHQGESGDHVRAAESAERAAEQAYGCFAFQRAAELFTLNASLRPPSRDAHGQRMLRRMAEALAHAGWSLSAAATYRDAAEFASAAEALHMKRHMLECLLRSGELEEAEQVLCELLAQLGVSRTPWSIRLARASLRLFGLGFRERREGQIPASELGKVDTLFTCAAQLSRCDLASGYALRSLALHEARTLGEPKRIARALCAEAWNVAATTRHGMRPRSAALIEAARSLVERQEAPVLVGHLRLAQGMNALFAHQVRECSALCRDAERVFRDSCSDVDWELSIAQVYQLLALSSMGQYRELAARLAQLRREAEERGDEWSYTAFLGIEALGVALALDAPRDAEALVREARSRWRARETLHAQSLFNLMASTSCDLYRHEAEAEARFAERVSDLNLPQFMRPRFSRVNVLELRGRARLMSAVRSKELSRLRAVDGDVRKLFAENERAASGFAQLLLANVYALRGDLLRAMCAVELGIAELEPLGLDPWVQSARYALGKLRGDDRGRTLEETARAQLKVRGVVKPERFVASFMPFLAQLGS